MLCSHLWKVLWIFENIKVEIRIIQGELEKEQRYVWLCILQCQIKRSTYSLFDFLHCNNCILAQYYCDTLYMLQCLNFGINFWKYQLKWLVGLKLKQLEQQKTQPPFIILTKKIKTNTLQGHKRYIKLFELEINNLHVQILASKMI